MADLTLAVLRQGGEAFMEAVSREQYLADVGRGQRSAEISHQACVVHRQFGHSPYHRRPAGR